MKPQYDLAAAMRGRDLRPSPGYQLMFPLWFIDPSARLGAGSTVWHFAVILANVVIGEDCSIGSRTEIGRGTVIGNRSRIGSGVFLPSNTVIGEGVFVGPGVVCTDDRHPRVPCDGDAPYLAEPPVIEDGAAIGAHATLCPGVHIGAGARIGAGAVVTKDVPAGIHVRGEPSRVKALSLASHAAWHSGNAG